MTSAALLPTTQLKYQQIEREIRALVESLPAGSRLPGEREMAHEYACNFLTVRKALKRLVLDGLIIRRTGSGTFVSGSGNAREAPCCAHCGQPLRPEKASPGP